MGEKTRFKKGGMVYNAILGARPKRGYFFLFGIGDVVFKGGGEPANGGVKAYFYSIYVKRGLFSYILRIIRFNKA